MRSKPDAITAAVRAIDGVRAKKSVGAAARARRLMERHIDGILRTVIAAAEAGDVGAAKILIERVVPIVRTAPLNRPVPLAGEPGEQADLVRGWLAEGKLSLEEAQALLDAIERAQKVAEHGALVSRIKELEARLKALGGDVIDGGTAMLPAPKGGPK